MRRTAPAAEPTLLHDFFSRAAARWPQHVAIDIPSGALRPVRHRTTYQELDRQSDAIAHRIAPAVTGESVVAVLLPRSSSHVYAAQLGVMKSGAAYTCCDLTFPDERLRDILADANPVAVLTDAGGRTRAINAGIPADRIVNVVELLHATPNPAAFTTPSWLTEHNLAYVIYTSGTTGRPKGVMIEHRSVVNLVGSDIPYFGLSERDRCVQCSSPAYDSSVEETWLAFAVGATLVVMDEHDARLGPDIVPWLKRERITFFCPPPTLLRASGCNDPAAALPELKYVYVGGEALPQDLSDRWAGACSLVNGYGPTECTVTVTRVQMRVGQPVTIGTPIQNVNAWIVDDALVPVPDGTQGELVIGGIALARGYWNQPELTDQRFPTHSTLGRLYRTGDLATRNSDGSIVYHGRGDAQVKLRGYRIELGAIESALTACNGVREAACTVQGAEGRQVLVAFIVPDRADTPPQGDTLLQALRTSLPDYMVPKRIGVLEELPVSNSGKLNRTALPRLDDAADNNSEPSAHDDRPTDDAPRSATESRIVAAMRHALESRGHVGVNDDFFTRLGGDSLSAAVLITALREHSDTGVLDVRDVYEARTAAALAQRAAATAATAARASNSTTPGENAPERTATANAPSPDRNVTGATLVQVAWILRSMVFGSVVAWFLAFEAFPYLVSTVGLVRLLLLAAPLSLLSIAIYAPLSVLIAKITKESLIGRYTACRADAWSSLHVRNWMVQQTVKSIPWWLIEGTEFQAMALRALGARIGKRVHIHRGVDLRQGGWDLLTLGDDVSLGQNVSLRIVELDQGQIVFAPVTIRDRATVEVHSGVGGNTAIEEDGYLSAGSSLSRGDVIPRGERWEGLPARPAGASPTQPNVPPDQRQLSPMSAALMMFAARIALSAFIALPTALIALTIAVVREVDTQGFLDWMYVDSTNAEIMISWVLISILTVPIALVMEALACRAMGRVNEGVIGRWTPGYLRVWLKPVLVDNGSRWLYGTLFWPSWLRLAGMKVGTGCEISSLIDTVPELVSIGNKTFCADGIYLAGAVVHRGTVSVAHTSIGADCFLGNGAIVESGVHMPDDTLLGVCTIASRAELRSGSAWFGNPPFELPHREVIAFDSAFTYDPSPLRYAFRVCWELARFAVPAIPALVAAFWFNWLSAEETLSLPVLVLFAVPAVTLCAALLVTLLIIGLKWAMLGKVRPGVHPLWSSWASRWDLMCLVWNVFASDIVSALDGTLLLNVLLRLVGVRIGKRVLLGADFAEDLPDPDMLTFEDGATVDCLFQAHTFEDRVLKIDRITIRRGATVGRNAVLLYGADIGANTRVAAHSVVMKHEHLRPNRTYAGFPTRPIDGAER